MKRIFKAGLRGGVVGAALCLLATGPALADLVVIRSTSPDLKAGQVVSDGARISLPAGSMAVLLGQDGKSTTVNGPFNGVPKAGGAGGDPSVVSSLSRLLSAGSGDTASLGVTRGGLFDDPFGINLTSGTYCAVPGRETVLNRGKAVRLSKLTVSGPGVESAVDWPKGDATLPWPASVPLKDGAAYHLTRDDAPDLVAITVRLVPASVKGDAAAAGWMGDNGCRAQGLAIVGRMR